MHESERTLQDVEFDMAGGSTGGVHVLEYGGMIFGSDGIFNIRVETPNLALAYLLKVPLSCLTILSPLSSEYVS